MSIEVSPEELEEAVADYGPTAYVLTAGDDGRPRVTHCTVEVADGQIRTRLGRSASTDAVARPAVSVLWPATMDQSMSLIADGLAEVQGDPAPNIEVLIAVSGAVRHRAAPPLDA